MKLKCSNSQKAISVIVVLCALFIRTTPGKPPNSPPKIAEVIKVGVTDYEDIEAAYGRYSKFFSELEREADKQPVTFTLAVGTYGEVLDWYNNGLIDVAVFSAMPAAQLLIADRAKVDGAYLGDLSVDEMPNPDLRPLRDDNLFPEPADPFKYLSGCIVLDADKEMDWESIKRLWVSNQVKFLFVKPYSMSGYILPLYALRNIGIDVTARPKQLEFTNSSGASLNKLKSEGKVALSGHQHLVAFVQDNARYKPTAGRDVSGGFSERDFGRIPLDGLKNYIPREIILANYNQTESDKFARTKLLVGHLLEKWNRNRGSNSGKRVNTQSGVGPVNAAVGDIAMRWQKRENWSQEYSDVIAALNSTRLPKQFLYRSSFNDLLRDLQHYASPRLALVLSRGGAKCAYQAGAIIEIERRLADLNETRTENAIASHSPKPKDLDIDLVVGTSGGAINALLVALRVTQPNQLRNTDDTKRIFASDVAIL
jgi:ABC-type phosphate/phosphonate transport system substrate-binding protein